MRAEKKILKSSCDSWRPYFSVKPLREKKMIPASESWHMILGNKEKIYIELTWFFLALSNQICVTLHIYEAKHTAQEFRKILCSSSDSSFSIHFPSKARLTHQREAGTIVQTDFRHSLLVKLQLLEACWNKWELCCPSHNWCWKKN